MDYSRLRNIKRVQRGYRQAPPITVPGFRFGLNTNFSPTNLSSKEASELINFLILKDGSIQTRPGVKLAQSYSSAVNFVDMGYIYRPYGTSLMMWSDDSGNLYYDIEGTITLGETADAAAFLLPYNNVMLVLDGGYIKYSSGNDLKICYDDGTGTTGYQFNNVTSEDGGNTNLGDGTNTRVAQKFTTQNWTAGYTIPPTTVSFKLSKNGNGYTGTDNVDLIVRIRKVSDDSIMAAKTLVSAPIADNVADFGDATFYETTFTSSDITTELSPNTAYYASLEYANGDASHYINVHLEMVNTGGLEYIYTGSWAAATTDNLLCSIKPGMPPKGSFGCIHNNRPFIAGDPDNPGYVWFGNLTYLDWSTPNGGGYISTVDDANTSYPAHAMVSLFNDLFVFGGKEEPYLTKLTGSSPEDYALPDTFQRAWAITKSVVATPNDIWVANGEYVSSIQGTNLYGDMRSSFVADPIYDKIKDYWTSGSMVAFHPALNLLFIYMPNYFRVLVCHVDLLNRYGDSYRYPWAEFEITKKEFSHSDYTWHASSGGTNEYYLKYQGGDPSIVDEETTCILIDGVKATAGTVGSLADHRWDVGDNDTLGYDTLYIRDDSGNPDTTGIDVRSILQPTFMKYLNGAMYFGGAGGKVFRMLPSEYLDSSSYNIRFVASPGVFIPHIDGLVIQRVNVNAVSKNGADFSLSIFSLEKSQSTPQITLDYSMAAVTDDWSILDSTKTLTQDWIEIEGYMFKFRFHDITLSGEKLIIAGLEAYIKPLEI